MKELSLLIPTPDGEMPVFAAIPQNVACAPGVLVYMDVFGPREELRDIARRFASCGYLAVLPHLFHRLGSPVFTPTNRADDVLADAVVRANDVTSLQGSAMDTRAIIDFAAAGGFGIRTRLWGTIGYCMGGRHALSAAATHPKQVRAAVSAHGGRMIDGTTASPHHLIARSTVPLHFAFAKDDATCPPDHQHIIEQLAARTAGRVTVEHLDAAHGWSFPDRWCFDRSASERVWEQALAMFRATLWTQHAPRLR